jgi:hypothetical protein
MFHLSAAMRLYVLHAIYKMRPKSFKTSYFEKSTVGYI